MWDLIVSVPDHCLSFYIPWRLHMNLTLIGQAVSEEKMFKERGRRLTMTDNGVCLYYKLTYEHKGSDELKCSGLVPIVFFEKFKLLHVFKSARPIPIG